jgi:hypothetical protein
MVLKSGPRASSQTFFDAFHQQNRATQIHSFAEGLSRFWNSEASSRAGSSCGLNIADLASSVRTSRPKFLGAF